MVFKQECAFTEFLTNSSCSSVDYPFQASIDFPYGQVLILAWKYHDRSLFAGFCRGVLTDYELCEFMQRCMHAHDCMREDANGIGELVKHGGNQYVVYVELLNLSGVHRWTGACDWVHSVTLKIAETDNLVCDTCKLCYIGQCGFIIRCKLAWEQDEMPKEARSVDSPKRVETSSDWRAGTRADIVHSYYALVIANSVQNAVKAYGIRCIWRFLEELFSGTFNFIALDSHISLGAKTYALGTAASETVVTKGWCEVRRKCRSLLHSGC